MKKNLKPYVYKQRENYVAIQFDLVLFVERANELWYAARLRCWSIGAVGKPSLKRASSYML